MKSCCDHRLGRLNRISIGSLLVEPGEVLQDPLARLLACERDFRELLGAGYRIRTGDLQLGKLTLYR